jgi:hypothetical protein
VKEMCKAEIIFEKMAGSIKIPVVISMDLGKSFRAGLMSDKGAQRTIKNLWKEVEPSQRKTLEKALRLKKNIILKNSNPAMKARVLQESEGKKRFVDRHELAHSIRSDKGKLSQRYYKFLPANVVEESAANVAALKKTFPESRILRTVAGTSLGTSQALMQRPFQTMALAGVGLGATKYFSSTEKKSKKQ